VFHGVTVNEVALEAVPPGVVIAIFPVTAPVGTTAVTCVSEFTVKLVEAIPPNVTLEAPVKLVPVIVTDVPTGPLVGVNVLIAGVTRNFTLLVRVPVLIFTVTKPFDAPLGTVAVNRSGDRRCGASASRNQARVTDVRCAGPPTGLMSSNQHGSQAFGTAPEVQSPPAYDYRYYQSHYRQAKKPANAA